MTKVLFLPEVVNQFLELAEVLYMKGYLGFKEVAMEYAEQLFTDMWYVFYSIHEVNGEEVYLIRYLGNNHVIAHHLLDVGKNM